MGYAIFRNGASEGGRDVALHGDSANDFGRYLRARASAIDVGAGRTRPVGDEKRGRVVASADEATHSAPARYSRPDEATKDTACRCYLRGPDGISGLAPSGTWSTGKLARVHVGGQERESEARR